MGIFTVESGIEEAGFPPALLRFFRMVWIDYPFGWDKVERLLAVTLSVLGQMSSDLGH
jgi:hypothetical protein